MKKLTMIVAAGAAVLLPGAGSAAILVNGSFEQGISNPGPYTTLANGDSTSITGWTVGGTVDYVGTYWQSEDGSRSVDLSGNTVGSISQTFSTVLNQIYQVSYFLSKNPAGGSVPRTGTVTVGSATQNLSYSLNNSLSDMMWQQHGFTFTGTGQLMTLAFAADATSGGFYGPAIDNVSIAAVPEPAAWTMMIAGFGMVGFAMRRRSRVATGSRGYA